MEVVKVEEKYCQLCGRSNSYVSIHKHHIYRGCYRKWSEKYKMYINLCFEHHRQIHNDREMELSYKRKYQKEFEKKNSREEFIKIFGQSYLEVS